MEVQETKTLKQYSNKQKILLVGEGDFSFSLSLGRAFGSASNITTSSLDSRGTKNSIHLINFVTLIIELGLLMSYYYKWCS